MTPAGALRHSLSKILLLMSDSWVSFNGALLSKISKTEIQLEGMERLSRTQSYLIIANHQSWVDIVILQKIFNKKTPFLRFFLKKELIWLPFLGIAFWALDFPFMKRYSKEYLKKHPEKAGQDLETTKKTCRKLSKINFALINFPEGTRANKQKLEKSSFSKLLKPKAGGVAFVLEAFEGKLNHLIDVSISYPTNDTNMYALLSGQISKVVIKVNIIEIPESFQNKSYFQDQSFRKEFQNWLNELWLSKDEWLKKDHF